VPHCASHEALADETPVLIAAGEETPERCNILLNLGDGTPPHFARFERLLEIVSRDDADRDAGRSRFRHYRERGYPIANHDLAASHE